MLVLLEEKYLLGTLETEELNQSFKPIIEKLEIPTCFVDAADWSIIMKILKATEHRGRFSRKQLLENPKFAFRAYTLKKKIGTTSVNLENLLVVQTPLSLALADFDGKLAHLKTFDISQFNVNAYVKNSYFSLEDFFQACNKQQFLGCFYD